MSNPLGGNRKDKKVPSLLASASGAVGLITIAAAIGISGVYAATVNFNGDTFLTAGSTPILDCTTSSRISFDQSVNDQGQTEVDGVTIEGIPSGCDGEIVALVIYNSSSTILDEVIWTLDLTSGDTEISAVANGTLTSGSNSSSGGISTNYPSSQTDPEGFEPGLLASTIDSVELLVLDADRAARD